MIKINENEKNCEREWCQKKCAKVEKILSVRMLGFFCESVEGVENLNACFFCDCEIVFECFAFFPQLVHFFFFFFSPFSIFRKISQNLRFLQNWNNFNFPKYMKKREKKQKK